MLVTTIDSIVTKMGQLRLMIITDCKHININRDAVISE